eukprot:COSAG01_NODE_12943_length_1659_cov_1.308333_1_plen_85_part_00
MDGLDKITQEAKAGGVLIFPGTTPHRSLNSTSQNIRWSTDFRLHPKRAARPGKGGELDWCASPPHTRKLAAGAVAAHLPAVAVD